TRFSRDWSSDVCSSDLLDKEHGTRKGEAPTGGLMNHFPRRTLCSAISGLGLTLLCSGVSAQTSAAPELDLTITVMEAGETPTGFINRLELPALETLEVPQPNT